MSGGYTEREFEQMGQWDHLGLEIQGKEVHMEDPEVAKQKLQRRHEELRRIDKQSQELQEKMLSSQKLNRDLGKQIETIDVTIGKSQAKDSEFSQLDSKLLRSRRRRAGNESKGYKHGGATIADVRKQRSLENNEDVDLLAGGGSVALNHSLLGSNSVSQRSNRSQERQVTTTTAEFGPKDGPPGIALKNVDLGVFGASSTLSPTAEPGAHAGTAGYADPLLPGSYKGPPSYLDADDLRLIRDFILLYSKNRFKRFKHQQQVLGDDLFLNQPTLRDKNLLIDLYYKLRQSQNLHSHVKNIEDKISGKVNQILDQQSKERAKLIEKGELLPDDPAGDEKPEEASRKAEKRLSFSQSVNLKKFPTLPAPSYAAEQKIIQKKQQNEDEVELGDRNRPQYGLATGGSFAARNVKNLPEFQDSLLSSAIRNAPGHRTWRDQTVQATPKGARVASKRSKQFQGGGLIQRSSLRFSNVLNFRGQEGRAVKRSQLKDAFRKNQFIKKIRDRFARRAAGSPTVEESADGEGHQSPTSASQEYQIEQKSSQNGRAMAGDASSMPTRTGSQAILREILPNFHSKKHTIAPTAANENRDGMSQSHFTQEKNHKGDQDQAKADKQLRNIRKHLITSQQFQRDVLSGNLGVFSSGQPNETAYTTGPQTAKHSTCPSARTAFVLQEATDQRSSQGQLPNDLKSSQYNESVKTKRMDQKSSRRLSRDKMDSQEYLEYLSNKKPMLPALGLNQVIEQQNQSRKGGMRGATNTARHQPGSRKLDQKSTLSSTYNAFTNNNKDQIKMFHINLYNERVLRGAKGGERAAIKQELESLKAAPQAAESAWKDGGKKETAPETNRGKELDEAADEVKSHELSKGPGGSLNAIPLPTGAVGAQAHFQLTERYKMFEEQLKGAQLLGASGCCTDRTTTTVPVARSHHAIPGLDVTDQSIAAPKHSEGASSRMSITHGQISLTHGKRSVNNDPLEKLLAQDPNQSTDKTDQASEQLDLLRQLGSLRFNTLSGGSGNGNQQHGQQSLKQTKHMISFKGIKMQTFTQAKVKMRSQKEERERILGDQYNPEKVRRERREQKRAANIQLERLSNFMKQGVQDCFDE